MKYYSLLFVLVILVMGCEKNKNPVSTQKDNLYVNSSILTDNYCYSIQISQIPLDNIDETLRIYNSLKTKYLVYYYKGPNKENYLIWESKINVGCFDSKIDAENYINIFKNVEGYESKVDSIRLFIDSYKNEFDIISTPSTIWKRSDNYTEELFIFDSTTVQRSSLSVYSKAVISPDGNNVVFYFNKKIIKLNLKTLKTTTLVENSDVYFWGLFNSQPRWSYNGEYIAFLDIYRWETTTSLWIIRPDGSNLTCLIDNTNINREAIKSFLWHPAKNEIIFVEGYPYGTITIGGSLYFCDLDGNKHILAEKNIAHNKEIHFKVFIDDKNIFYRVGQLDEEYMQISYSDHTIEIP